MSKLYIFKKFELLLWGLISTGIFQLMAIFNIGDYSISAVIKLAILILSSVFVTIKTAMLVNYSCLNFNKGHLTILLVVVLNCLQVIFLHALNELNKPSKTGVQDLLFFLSTVSCLLLTMLFSNYKKNSFDFNAAILGIGGFQIALIITTISLPQFSNLSYAEETVQLNLVN